MIKFIPILLVSILATISASALRDDVKPAITRKMKSAGEKYVKMILKEFPEKAEGLSGSKARKKMYDELAKSGMLTVDGATQELLKRRKEVVKEADLKTVIKNLEKDDSKETKFLLTLANNERIKGEGKLLVYRLLVKTSNAFVKKANENAKEEAESKQASLADIFAHYEKRKKELGRMPADLEELALPKAIAQSSGKDWIYFGTRINLGTELGRILLFDPNALPGGKVTKALTDKGKVVNLNYEEMMGHWNKVKDKPAPKPKTDDKAEPEKEPENKPAPAPAAANTEYDKKTLADFTAAFKKVVDKRNATKIWPASLEEAGLEGEELTQDSPDGTEKKRWVYIASKAKIAVGKNQFIIMTAHYPTGGNHLVALSDGKVASISAAEYEEIEKAIEDK